MKPFSQKKEELAKLKDRLAKAKIAILTSFAREGERGLKVAEMRQLKKDLKAAESEYLVEKKTILDRAISPKEGIDVFGYQGSLGLVLGYGDEAATAKSVYVFARKNPTLKLFSAILDQRVLDTDKLTELAKLPPKSVMVGRLVGTVKYPITGLLSVLQGNIRNLLIVLSNIKK